MWASWLSTDITTNSTESIVSRLSIREQTTEFKLRRSKLKVFFKFFRRQEYDFSTDEEPQEEDESGDDLQDDLVADEDYGEEDSHVQSYS